MRSPTLAKLTAALVLSLVLAACGSNEEKPQADAAPSPDEATSTKIVFPEHVGDFEKMSDDAPMVIAARESLAADDPTGELHAEISFYARGNEHFQLMGSNPPPGSAIARDLQRSPEISIDYAMKAVPVPAAQSFDTKIPGLVLKCGTLADDHAQMCAWADKTSFAQLIMGGVESSDAAAELARLFIKHVRVES